MAAHTLSEILKIPGNEVVYQRLQGLLQAGSAIAFVGAGASAPLYPLWTKLIAELAHEPVLRGLAKETDEQYWLSNAASKPLQVASQIRSRLGDQLYRTFLYETFKDRTGDDGLPYTSSHAALMRMNFQAYVTTNYDAGVLEARRHLWPGIRDTSFTLWNQNFPVNRWASGDRFKGGAERPVLFAHGHFADPASIILDRGSYRQAYHDTPYRRFFENLWFQQHLVFVGFSFNDVVLTQIADEVLSETTRQGGSQPRHIAIIGFHEPYSEEMRTDFLESYDAEALFYPVADGDHSALRVLLDSIAMAPAPALTPVPAAVGVLVASALEVLFVHETTEDEKFTGRGDNLERLDRWAGDPGVRLIAITAIGGLGKTALVGRWLRQGKPAAARPCDGTIFWSFYREREPEKFFEALVAFGREKFGWSPRDAEAAPGSQALDLLVSRRLIVALDGLEVIQEAPGTVAYGKLLEIDLAEFLHDHCAMQNGSLLLLTSRFPFPDLTGYLGGALRSLPLPSLESAEGADLLAALGMGGRPEDREGISRRLDGHPLALRVFARSAPAEVHGDPTRLWEMIFDDPHLTANDPLDSKIERLLVFYEKWLPEPQRQALGLVALFRAPVGEATLAPLWKELLRKHGGGGSLHSALQKLRVEHLLTVDTGRYACHPILRDHFRCQILREPGFTREAAGLIAGSPDAGKARSREAVQTVATAVEMLLDADDVKAADDLYRSRLDRGSVFLDLPAPHWGMEVARSFVRDEVRREALSQAFGPMGLGSYLNDVALFANDAGEPQTALEFYGECTDIARQAGDHTNFSRSLSNLGETESYLGMLVQAADHFTIALESALKRGDDGLERIVLAFNGHVTSLRGDAETAEACFSEANAIENRKEASDLYSLRGIQWAEHLLRTGSHDRARRLTEVNLTICERHRWQNHVARCEWILGWLAVLVSRWEDARAHLSHARATFTAGHMIQELARILLTEAACDLGQGQWDSALAASERALQLAAPRGYRLIHADALNLRARAMLERPDPDAVRARDDAEAALQLAEFSEYAWAQRDALQLLTRAHRRLGNEGEAHRCQQRADEWNRRLRRAPAAEAHE